MKAPVPAPACPLYLSARHLAEALQPLTVAEVGDFPITRQGIDYHCKKFKVPSQRVKSKGGPGGKTTVWLLTAIPGLPEAVKVSLGLIVTNAVESAGAAAAKEHKEEVRRTAEEQLRHKEECLRKFGEQPEARQRSARAKRAVLTACTAFLQAGKYRGRLKDGRETWHTKGVEAFIQQIRAGKVLLEPWVLTEISRKGKIALGYTTIITWRTHYESDGMFGLIDHYVGRDTCSLTREQRDFIEACLVDRPNITIATLILGVEARFSGSSIPSDTAIYRYVNKWKAENASLLLYIANPDEWRSTYQFAVGNCSEGIERLNQLWEADSTPGDLLLIDGRHTIIGIIDVQPRRVRFLVSKTSKSAAIGALIRHCIIVWGVPEAIKTDNGTDYTANYIEDLLHDVDIEHLLCPPFTPEAKPHIERALQTMSHSMVELLPGYIGHSVAERKAIESRKSFAERLMTRGETVEVLLTAAQLQEKLDRWTNAWYMQSTHDGLGGKTPAEMVQAWDGPVRKIADERALDVLLLPVADYGGTRVIKKTGIAVTHGAAVLHYSAPEFAGHEGERVVVKPDWNDLGHAAIYRESGEYLCWATDPAWYGINSAEAAMHLKNRQKEVMRESAKEARAKARKKKVRGLSDEILEYKEAQLRAATENVVEMPKRQVSHTTPALEQAARAVEARQAAPVPEIDRDRIGEKLERLAEAIEAEKAQERERLAAEEARRREALKAKVVALHQARQVPEFPGDKWQLWQVLDAEIAAGKLPESAELCSFYLNFHRTPAYKGMRRCLPIPDITPRDLTALQAAQN